MAITKLTKTLSRVFWPSRINRKIKIKLSEHWCVLKGFDGDFYLLNEIDGRWLEIGCQDAKALFLCDGRRSVDEISDFLCQETLEEYGKVLNDTLRFFEKGYEIGALKIASHRKK